jgi:Na+:H+ antiporter, NhaA family
MTKGGEVPDPAVPPGEDGVRQTWSRSDRTIPRLVVRPLQRFLATEVSSGVVLLAAALVALVWANSPWSAGYESLWDTRLTLRLGSWALGGDLRRWVNDGLMTLFFFVVGLEIKRELVTGELHDRRAAALPVVAAVGGMVVPALLYLAVNPTPPGRAGWGVAMATDIPFALGVVALLGRRVDPALKVFLLAMAIVDDLGSIVVIAVFARGAVDLRLLGLSCALLAGVVALRGLHVRWMAAYVGLGVAAWAAMFDSGVAPTVVGAALGLLTPAVPFQRPRVVSEEAVRVAEETGDDPDPPDADAPQWLYLAGLSREAASPLARLETVLHPWTGYVVVPLFALANAGIALGGGVIRAALTGPVGLGVILGRVVGKPLGITLASLLVVRLGAARLPKGVGWIQLAGVAALAGIGFTVAFLIAELTLPGPGLQDAAKLGVLAAGVLSGVIGASILAWRARATVRAGSGV